MFGIIGIVVDTVTIGVNLGGDTEAFNVITPEGEDFEGVLGWCKA